MKDKWLLIILSVLALLIVSQLNYGSRNTVQEACFYVHSKGHNEKTDTYYARGVPYEQLGSAPQSLVMNRDSWQVTKESDVNCYMIVGKDSGNIYVKWNHIHEKW